MKLGKWFGLSFLYSAMKWCFRYEIHKTATTLERPAEGNLLRPQQP